MSLISVRNTQFLSNSQMTPNIRHISKSRSALIMCSVIGIFSELWFESCRSDDALWCPGIVSIKPFGNNYLVIWPHICAFKPAYDQIRGNSPSARFTLALDKKHRVQNKHLNLLKFKFKFIKLYKNFLHYILKIEFLLSSKSRFLLRLIGET